MKTLNINLSKSYPLYIGNGLLQSNMFNEYCLKLNKRIAIITDHNLVTTIGKQLHHQLQQQKLNVELLSFKAGENYKTRETKQQLEDELLQRQYGRDTYLIALGGGIVTDVVGFVAATYCRGVPVMYLPTTLLAMVDACIGGKTAVNTSSGKNLIGLFSQPDVVFMDIATLNTLPQHEWHNGIAETIKHAVICDKRLFMALKNNIHKINKCDPQYLINIIYQNCLIKKNIIELDEQENGLRQILNFGHTIGHAIEAASAYQISHGCAVAMGMLVEGYISHQHGLLTEADLSAMINITRHYNFPLKTNVFANDIKFKNLLMMDKKTINSKIHFVMLDEIGKYHQHQNQYSMSIDNSMLSSALQWARTFFS